jgi:hypothetical protein
VATGVVASSTLVSCVVLVGNSVSVVPLVVGGVDVVVKSLNRYSWLSGLYA